MSIQITITDPTRDEALRLADYLFALAGYSKTEGVVAHERTDTSGAVARKFETTPAQVGVQLKSQIELMAGRTPVEQFIDEADTSAGVPPAAPHAVETDSAGHAWDERIHASSRAVVSDGTWRLRRNLDPAVLEAVLAERGVSAPVAVNVEYMDQHGAIHNETLAVPAPGAWPFPSDAGVPPPPASVDVPPQNEPEYVSIPPPPTGAAPLTFAAFMSRVTAAIGAGTIAQTDVSAALAEYSVASIPLLASVHADKIDAVAARLGV